MPKKYITINTLIAEIIVIDSNRKNPSFKLKYRIAGNIGAISNTLKTGNKTPSKYSRFDILTRLETMNTLATWAITVMPKYNQ